MDTNVYENLSQRLDQLETEARRWKIAAIGFGMVLMLMVGMGSGLGQKRGVLEAEQLVLRDKDGRVRMQLSAESEYGPELTMRDTQGNTLVQLQSLGDDSSALQFFDRGDLRMYIGSQSDGTSMVHLLNEDHQPAGTLYSSTKGTGLMVRNRDSGFHLQIQEDDQGRLTRIDSKGGEHEIANTDSNLSLIKTARFSTESSENAVEEAEAAENADADTEENSVRSTKNAVKSLGRILKTNIRAAVEADREFTDPIAEEAETR